MRKYKYSEDSALEWIKTYIDRTYGEHYAKGKIQTTEFVFDAGHGEGFCVGNVIKYIQRWGKKGGRNVDDLYKAIHYAIILLGVTETERAKILAQSTGEALDALGKRSKEEGTRKLDGGEYSESYPPAPAHFSGGEAYNKKGSV
jgi:hypothetical protein